MRHIFLLIALPCLLFSACSTFDRDQLQGEWHGIAFEGEHVAINQAETVVLRIEGKRFAMTGMVADVVGTFHWMGNTLVLTNGDGIEWPISVKSLNADELVLNLNRSGKPALLKLRRD